MWRFRVRLRAPKQTPCHVRVQFIAPHTHTPPPPHLFVATVFNMFKPIFRQKVWKQTVSVTFLLPRAKRPSFISVLQASEDFIRSSHHCRIRQVFPNLPCRSGTSIIVATRHQQVLLVASKICFRLHSPAHQRASCCMEQNSPNSVMRTPCK